MRLAVVVAVVGLATVGYSAADEPANQSEGQKEGKSNSSERFRVAQGASQGSVGAPAAGAPGELPSPSKPAQLEEILVTAQKRSERLQDVPVSVSAFDQGAITKLGLTDIEGLTRMTPGLDLTVGPGGQSIVSIRGVVSTFGTATTGIYIDDTPIQVRFIGQGETAGNAYPDLFDLDRIEVLRGPQGTLFGSGSEGGTVRFITPQPSLTEIPITPTFIHWAAPDSDTRVGTYPPSPRI